MNGPIPLGTRATPRAVQRVDEAHSFDGPFRLPGRRFFPTPHADGLDPFLLVERWGPGPASVGLGGPEPHQRLQQLLWVRSGVARVRVSRAALAEATLGPGDVALLDATDGVVAALDAVAGPLDVIRVWLDTPARRRGGTGPSLVAPGAAAVPTVPLDEDGSRLRPLAGFTAGVAGPLEPAADALVAHVVVAPARAVSLPVPPGPLLGAVVLSGSGAFGLGAKRRSSGPGGLVRFDGDGTTVPIEAQGVDPLEVLLLTGRPLGRPVVRYGPFIGDDEPGIREAMRRFQQGRFGALR
jgi:redox-sensitive bicupin YhaK (pirin superfamily)